MNAPPPVVYPVGRPNFLAGVLVLLAVSGALLTVAAAHTRPDDLSPDWMPWLVGLASWLPAAFALRAWRRLGEGLLKWDGQAWQLLASPSADVLPLAWIDALDTPSVLLIRVRPMQGMAADAGPPRFPLAGDRWIWASRHTAPDRWHALRCAALASMPHRAGIDERNGGLA